MAMQDKSAAGKSTLVRPSHRLLSLFGIYLHWYIGRHFHALRLAHSSRFPIEPGPLIVYLNHASWWDPLTCIVISRHFLPAAFHYAPMEAAALKHYGFLRKLGLFPIETGTRRGAASSAATPRGTLIQKIVRQPSPATSVRMRIPPMSWPEVAARPITIPYTLIARTRAGPV